MTNNARDPQELSDKSFDAEVLLSNIPVVVEFFTDWERPWRALSRDDWGILNALYGAEIRCACLDTGKNRAIALRYKVESIPNVFVFVGEKCVAQFFGRTKLAEVREAVERALAQVATPAKGTKEPKLKTWEIPRPMRSPQGTPSFA